MTAHRVLLAIGAAILLAPSPGCRARDTTAPAVQVQPRRTVTFYKFRGHYSNPTNRESGNFSAECEDAGHIGPLFPTPISHKSCGWKDDAATSMTFRGPHGSEITVYDDAGNPQDDTFYIKKGNGEVSVGEFDKGCEKTNLIGEVVDCQHVYFNGLNGKATQFRWSAP